MNTESRAVLAAILAVALAAATSDAKSVALDDCGSPDRVALTCADVVASTPNAQNGLYHLADLEHAEDNLPRLAYCETGFGGHELVFKYTTSVDGDPATLFKQGRAKNNLDTDKDVFGDLLSARDHYVNPLLGSCFNEDSGCDIDSVLVVLYEDGLPVLTLPFDTTGKGPNDWFNLDSLQASPWVDLDVGDDDDLWGITGANCASSFPRWLIQKESACDAAEGWLRIPAEGAPVEYSKASGAAAWNDANKVGKASVFAVFARVARPAESIGCDSASRAFSAIAGPASSWDDEDYRLLDLSGNSNYGDTTSGVDVVFPWADALAVDLDMSDRNRVTVEADGDWGGAFTLFATFKRRVPPTDDDDSVVQEIAKLYMSGAPAAFEIQSYADDIVRARVVVKDEERDDDDWDFVSRAQPAGAWHHVSLGYDQDTGLAQFSLDGAISRAWHTTGGVGDAWVTDTSMELRYGAGFDGFLRDLRYYKELLSEQEVVANFARMQRLAAQEGLVVQWGLRDGVGTIVRDSSSYGNFGVVRGAEFDGDALRTSSFATAVVSAATMPIETKGRDDPEFTFAAWVKRAGDGWSAVTEAFMGLNNDGNVENGAAYVSVRAGFAALNFGKVRMEVEDIDMSPGRWHHVAVTKSAGDKDETTHIYLDGKLMPAALVGLTSSRSRNDPPEIDDPAPLVVGRGSNNPATGVWDGWIADARCYSYAIPRRQIREVYGEAIAIWWNGLRASSHLVFDQSPAGGAIGSMTGVGVENGLLRFAGENSFVVSRFRTSVLGDAPVTLMVWVYYDGTAWPKTSAGAVFLAGMVPEGGSLGRADRLSLLMRSSSPVVEFGEVELVAEIELPVKQWHHLAVSKVPGEKGFSTSIYVNGNPTRFWTTDIRSDAEDVDAPPDFAPNFLRLGYDPDSMPEERYLPFSGYMAHAQLLRTPVSETVARAMMRENEDGLRRDMALRLNGDGDYVRVPPIWFGGGFGNLTMEATVFARTPYAAGQIILDTGEDVESNRVTVELEEGTGRLIYTVNNGPDGQMRYLIAGDPVPMNRWVHVTVVADQNRASIYYDDNLQAVGATIIPRELARPHFFVGKSVDSESTVSFQGYIDNVRVWRGSFTPAQVKDALAISFAHHYLLVHYRFDALEPSPFAAASPPTDVADWSGKFRPGITKCSVNCVVPGPAAVSLAVCGDGARHPAEECDDGNLANDDGCDASCGVEQGWVCSQELAGAADVCEPGNELFLENFEETAGEWTTQEGGFGSWDIGTSVARSGSRGLRLQQKDILEFSELGPTWDYDGFEETAEWNYRQGGVYPLQDCETSYKGDCSCFFSGPWGRNWEGNNNREGQQTNTGYATEQYELLCMAYKIPPTTYVSMLMIVDGHWRSLYMTQLTQPGRGPNRYAAAGDWRPIEQDNRWHYKCIDFHAQVQAAFGTGNHWIRAWIWHTFASTAYHGAFWVDEIAVAAKPGKDVVDVTVDFDLDTFEDSVEWTNRNNNNNLWRDCTTSWSGKCSLRMHSGWGRNFEWGTREPGQATGVWAAQFPYMCMAYRIPPTTKVNMLVYVEWVGWRSLTMTETDNPRNYPRVGTWQPLQVDDEWHYKCIDWHEQISSSPNVGVITNIYIRAIIWHRGYTPANEPYNGHFWIDDFQVTKTPPKKLPCSEPLPEEDSDRQIYYDLDTFEIAADEWNRRNIGDPYRICNNPAHPPYRGACSLYNPVGWGRNFEGGNNLESGQHSSGFSTEHFNTMCMAYKLPPDTVVNMLIHVYGYGWRSLLMTQSNCCHSYPKAGDWNEGSDGPLKRDEQWHYTCIDLDAQMRKYVGDQAHNVNAVIWHYMRYEPNARGGYWGHFWIDDFAIKWQDRDRSKDCSVVTHGERPLEATIGADSHLELDVRMQNEGSSGQSAPLMITLMGADVNKRPMECANEGDEGCTHKFYRLCYNLNAKVECDETRHVPLQRWVHQSLAIVQQFEKKYGRNVALPTDMKVVVAAYTEGAFTDVWVDNVAVVDRTVVPLPVPLSVTSKPLKYRSCRQIKKHVAGAQSGKYTIHPDDFDPIEVYCDMDADGGGWIVFQRRQYMASGQVDFYRDWAAYKAGFGDVTTEHWLGNDYLSRITSAFDCEARIELCMNDGSTCSWQKAARFSVSDEDDEYRLTILDVTSSPDNLPGRSDTRVDRWSYHNTMRFSTYDNDNDASGSNCASSYKGGWWYRSCHYLNYNGRWATHGGSTPNTVDYNWPCRNSYHCAVPNIKMTTREVRELPDDFGTSIRIGQADVATTTDKALRLAAVEQGDEGNVRTETFDWDEVDEIVDFIAASPEGEIILGAMRWAEAEVGALDSDIADAFATIGLRVPKITVGTRWAFITRKGATFGDAQSSVARDDTTDVDISTRFTTARQPSVTVPENAVFPAPRMSLWPEYQGDRLQVVGEAERMGLFRALDTGGAITPVKGFLDYEGPQGDSFEVKAQSFLRGFDSGWVDLSSQAGDGSFVEHAHEELVEVPPHRRLALGQVLIGGTSANAGFVFETVGSAMRTDNEDTPYSGVVLAHSPLTVRLWAPAKNDVDGSSKGRMMMIDDAWGNGKKKGDVATAQVRVTLLEEASPDYDSGWFTMKSNVAGDAYEVRTHGLSGVPDRVRVLVNVTDGENAGFIFEASGAAGSGQDSGNPYGGVIYAYSANEVRVWAPALSSGDSNGYIAFVADGWAANSHAQASSTANVRILAWEERLAPAYESDWIDMESGDALEDELVFQELEHGLGMLPARVHVQVKHPSNGFYFDGIGAAQNGEGSAAEFGGAVFAYSDEKVRIWAPTSGDDGHLIHVPASWGAGQGTMVADAASVRVRAWRTYGVVADTAVARFDVKDVNEPPTARATEGGGRWGSNPAAQPGDYLGTVDGSDSDAGTVRSFELISGDPQGIFRLDPLSGVLTVERPELFDIKAKKVHPLGVRVSDGLLSDTAPVIVTLEKVNRPPRLEDNAVFEVPEDAEANYKLGTMNYTDPDEDDSLLFSIAEGNEEGHFKIDVCTGLIRVKEPQIDFETKNEYWMIVALTDDGIPPLNDTTNITIHVLDRNDPPSCPLKPVLDIDENVGIGTAAGDVAAVDPEGTDMTWEVFGGTGAFMFDVLDNGTVVTKRDGLDYETRTQYTLTLQATDQGDPPLSCDTQVTMRVQDVNDPPVFFATTLGVPENSEGGTIVGVLAASDQDGDEVEISLAEESPLFDFAPGGQLTVKDGAVLNYEVTPSVNIIAQATDGTVVVNATIAVRLEDMNDPPTVNVSSFERSIHENAVVGAAVGLPLVGNDEDEDTLMWTIEENDYFDVVSTTGQVIVRAPADYEALLDGEGDNVIDVRVNVSDGLLQGSAVISITVTDRNDAPTVVCSPQVEWLPFPDSNSVAGLVEAPGEVGGNPRELQFFGDDLSETACRDACLEDEFCFAWTLFSDTYFSEGFRGQCYGRSATLDVMVSEDGAGGVTSEKKLVLCQSFSVDEDTALGDAIGEVLEFVDQDDDSAQWSIASGNTGGALALGLTSGVLSVSASGPGLDFESVAKYVVKVQLVDSGVPPQRTTASIGITVNDVNEPPVFEPPEEGENYILRVTQTGASAGELMGPPLIATDPEGGGVTFQLQVPDEGGFVECGAGGQLSVAKQISLAKDSVIYVTIRAEDDVSHTDADIQILVQQGNNPPRLTRDQEFHVSEDTVPGPDGSVIGRIVAVDDDVGSDDDPQTLSFVVRSVTPRSGGTVLEVDEDTGDIKLIGPVNYEGPANVYTLNMRVSDSATPPMFDETTVTVIVDDANDVPWCPPVQANVTEDANVGRVVAVGVLCYDEDPGDTLEFTLSGAGSSDLSTSVAANEPRAFDLSVAQPLDYETRGAYTLTLTVSDDGTPEAQSVSTVNIEVLNVNEPPVAVDAAFSVPEDSTPGTPISTLVATDPDRDLLTWTVTGGDDTEYFTLFTTGTLVVGTKKLDYESKTSFTLDVLITDNGLPSLSTTIEVTVDVTNVNDVTISSISGGSALLTEGGEAVRIYGSDFGPVAGHPDGLPDAVVTAVYGPPSEPDRYEASDCSVTTKNTEITCLSAEGIGDGHVWTITVSGDSASSEGVATTSYAPPRIISLARDEGCPLGGTCLDQLSTLGTQRIVINGTGFGPYGSPVTAIYGGGNLYWRAAQCTVNILAPHREIICRTRPGVGSGHTWKVKVGATESAWSPATATTSYESPEIFDISGSEEMTTYGGDVFVIDGSNFGPLRIPLWDMDTQTESLVDSPVILALYGRNERSEFEARCVVLQEHRRLQCVSAAGVGRHLDFSVVVGQQSSKMVSSNVGYLPPRLDQVSGEGSTNAATEGGQRVVINGDEFGPVSLNAVEKVTYGPTGTEYVAVNCRVNGEPPAAPAITCLTAVGTGKGHSWKALVGGQWSELLDQGTSYAAPIVSFFDGPGARAAETEGGQWVDVHGRNMGADPTKIQAVNYMLDLDGLEVEYVAENCTLTVPHERLRCYTVEGAGRDLGWTVVVDGQPSSNPATHYGVPVIRQLIGNTVNASTDGGEQVWLVGENFGPAEAFDGKSFVSEVTYGPAGVEYNVKEIHVENHTHVLITTVPAVGSDLAFRIVVAGQRSAASEARFSHHQPEILELTPDNGPTLNDGPRPIRVQVVGRNLGMLDPTVSLSITFGNEGDRTAQLIPDPDIRRDAPLLTDGVPAADGLHRVSFILPEGIAPRRGVVIHVKSTHLTAAVNSLPGEFNYNKPDLRFVEVTAFRGGGDEGAWLDVHFPSERSQLRRLRAVGSDFGLPQLTDEDGSVADGADTVQRELLVQPLELGDGGVLVAAANATYEPVLVYRWDHTEVVAYSTSPYGNLRVSIAAKTPTGADMVVTSTTSQYADFSPVLDLLESPEGGWSTAGGEILTIPVSYIQTATELYVLVSTDTGYFDEELQRTVRRECNCTITDADGNDRVGDWIPDFIAAGIEDWQRANPGESTVPSDVPYDLHCRLPPGTGSNAFVTLFRNGVVSAGLLDTPEIEYGPPIITTATTWDNRDAEGTPVVSRPVEVSSGGGVVDGSVSHELTVTVPTTGGRVRFDGTNLGECPELHLNGPDGRAMSPVVFSFCDEADKLTCCPVGDDCSDSLSEFAIARSHDFVEIEIPAGQGADLVVDFFSDNPLNGLTTRIVLNYAQPELHNIVVGGEAGARASTAGGDQLVLEGAHFGPADFFDDEVEVWLEAPGYDYSDYAALGDRYERPADLQAAIARLPPVAVPGLVDENGDLLRFPCTNPAREDVVDDETGAVVHGRLSCDLPRAAGDHLEVHVSISGQRLAVSGAEWPVIAYKAPVIESIEVNITAAEANGAVTAGVAPCVGTSALCGGTFVRGPSLGGFLVTVHGSEFGDPTIPGLANQPRQLCVAVSPDYEMPLCEFDVQEVEEVDASGRRRLVEVEVPRYEVVEHTPTRVTFRMPAGMGRRFVAVNVAGQGPARQYARSCESGSGLTEPSDPKAECRVQAIGRFQYASPVIHSMNPASGDTNGGEFVTLLGDNFGTMELLEDAGYTFEVQFGIPGVNCSVPATEQCMLTDTCRCMMGPEVGRQWEHDHQITGFTLPGGIGTGVPVRILLRDQYGDVVDISQEVKFDYNPPVVIFNEEKVHSAIPIDKESGLMDVVISGINFGRPEDMQSWTDDQQVIEIVMTSSGELGKDELYTCVEPQRRLVDRRLGNIDRVDCKLPETTAGYKHINITIAGQQGGMTEEQYSTFFLMECPVFTYGQQDEVCLDCPQGATCDGGQAEPVAIEGWYNIPSPREEGHCVPERQHREVCNHVVPCEPKEACTGANTCAVGYIAKAPVYRCSDCDPCYKEDPDDPDEECQPYYKLSESGECIECPDNPLLLILAFLCGAVALCVTGYILNRKNVHLAFLSIGVDYFQVLALFAGSRVQWPPLLKQMFRLLSVFNLNIEITAPECSIPDLTYDFKWFSIEGLPLCAATLFLLLHWGLVIKKRCLLGRKKKLHSHASALIAMSLVMFYFLYLYLTTTTLSVFNCAPTDPPDGYSYLSVAFVRCWDTEDPDNLQLRLLPFAVVTLLVYTFGYPSLVGYLLWKNNYLVQQDQLLRAIGQGDTRLENPNAYDVRKRYHKLYYHFKPSKWFWILVIILRKFFIAFTKLMFNRNPAFQLSMALLVMFVSYAAQVKNRPYMSLAERDEVIREHTRLAQEGDVLQQRLRADITSVQRQGKKKTRQANLFGSAAVRARDNKGMAAAMYFSNYNTVEQWLLACAVLVTLSGVMFESAKFQSEYYEDQRDAITVVIVIVIFWSIMYFMSVFFMEVVITLCPGCLAKCFKIDPKKAKQEEQKAKKRASAAVEMMAVSPGGGGGADDDTAPQMNPMFAAMAGGNAAKSPGGVGGDVSSAISSDTPPDAQTWASVKKSFAELQQQTQAMAEANRALKKKMTKMRETDGSARTAGRKRTTRKVQHAPRQAARGGSGAL